VEFEIRLFKLDDRPFPADVVRRHVDALARLDHEGRLIAAGPLADGSGGLILARFDDLAAAQAYAADEPFVTAGLERAEVRRWVWANRDNGYLLDS
jgi:uncharacterized protein